MVTWSGSSARCVVRLAAEAPIRVLWLAKGLGPGGMERLLVHHARVGDRSRFHYSVGYLVERPHSVAEELRALDVTVVKLPGSGGPATARALRRLVRDQGIDVVHVHSPLLAAVVRPAMRTMAHRPAVVATEHNSWDCYSLPTRFANVATYPLDDARFAVSVDAAESVPRLLRGATEVLVHGIDLDEARASRGREAAVRAELGIAESQPIVLMVANHRGEKAWEVMLRAAVSVRERHPDVVFLGAGHGPLQLEHERLHATLGLGSTFRILGFRDDVAALLDAADVFALSSRQEGLPVALMEAMSRGLPVVATAVGGLPDVVGESAGILVQPEDPAALAGALCRVLDDTELRNGLAVGSAEAAECFDVRRAVARLEAVYSQLAR